MALQMSLGVSSASIRKLSSSPTATRNPSTMGGGKRQCFAKVGTCDMTGVDLFPDKLKADYSVGWNVTYAKTYKIIHNKAAGQTFVAYQCGTTKPQASTLPTWVQNNNPINIEIPITKVSIASTTHIPMVEFLGERESIFALAMGTSTKVSSECVKKMLDTKATKYDKNSTQLKIDGVQASFCDQGWGCPGTLPNPVILSAHKESSNLATAEWVEYLALFYNKEKAVKEIVTAIDGRYNCNKKKGKVVTTKPKVLWANYYGDGWSVGKCPNYYCEIIADAGGEMITSFPASGSANYGYMNDTEFLAHAKDADVWIYPGNNFYHGVDPYGSAGIVDGPSAKTTVLNQIKAFQNNKVYDSLRGGLYDWFEGRISQPDIVLLDMLSIVQPSVTTGHTRLWLRKLLPIESKEAVGTETKGSDCVDVAAPRGLRPEETCGTIPTTIVIKGLDKPTTSTVECIAKTLDGGASQSGPASLALSCVAVLLALLMWQF